MISPTALSGISQAVPASGAIHRTWDAVGVYSPAVVIAGCVALAWTWSWVLRRDRAASFWTRTYAPELSLGLQTREEAIDIETVDANEVPTAPTVPKARKRNVETIPVDATPATPAAAPEPPTETAQATPEPPAEPAAPAAPEPTMLERCEDWLSKTGIPFEFVQRKLSDVEAYKDAGTRALEDLSDAELTILQRNGRSIERAWRASQPKP